MLPEACLNGVRRRGTHERLPITPADFASVNFHEDGEDTRAALHGVAPVGLAREILA